MDSTVTLESALKTANNYRELFKRIKFTGDAVLQQEILILADEVLRLRTITLTPTEIQGVIEQRLRVAPEFEHDRELFRNGMKVATEMIEGKLNEQTRSN
jgi:hypothetical protein